MAGLVELHAIEESFNDDKGHIPWFLAGAVNVEQFLRFTETLRQLVFGRSLGWLAGETTSVGDNLAFRVLDGNGNPIRHHAFGTEAHAEIHNGFERESPFGKIRMTALQLVQTELERLVGNAVFLNRCRLRGWLYGCRFARIPGLWRFACVFGFLLG